MGKNPIFIGLYTEKTQVNHLTNLSHSGSVHGQNDSKMCENESFLSVW